MSTAIKKKPITRNRETLTCLQCRARKLKCDKQLPCGACAKRNEQGICSYAKHVGRRQVAEESRASKAEARLQHLEHLVQEFVGAASTSSSTGPRSNGQEDNNNNNNTLVNTSQYAGATHYSAMLEDIDELRQFLGDEDPGTSSNPPPSNDSMVNETEVLFGGTPRLPLANILASHLPPKQEVDRRVAAYFRAEAIAAPFIHVPQFMRQYEQFWTNQLATPPLWISMLFSICHLSQSTGRGAGVTRSVEDVPNGACRGRFSLAAAHCLTLGRYSRPQRFAVEALCVYLQSKVIESLDPSRESGILFGTLIQVAYCMGYHRDPDNFKTLTPFEGEMRRRAWSHCMQLDLLVSFGLGLPNNVHFGSWNTKIPHNLRDSDFDEHDTVLPPPRPDNEPTKVTFYTAKHTLMTIFDKILKHALSVTGPKPESELTALDAELEAKYESIPAIFHYKSVETSLCDPIYLVTTRKCVELMYQKCRCVLHRPHISQGRTESAWICFHSASIIVKSFLELYPEWKPGGQFHDERWLLGSITWNDWLLGVMVLCLVLCQFRKSSIPNLSDEDLQNLVRLLKGSKAVCEEKLDESMGARRTNRLLEALLCRVGDGQQQGGLLSATDGPDTSRTSPPQTLPDFNWQEHTDMLDGFQNWNENLFDTQEWSFLEDCLNTNFDV